MRDRRRAERHGRRAERLAALWLRCKGYRLLAQRLKTAHGEIDLVLRRGTQIIYVEVKARTTLAAAQEALSPRTLLRLHAAMRIVLSRFDREGRLNHRCDAVLIAPRRFPRHIMQVISDTMSRH